MDFPCRDESIAVIDTTQSPPIPYDTRRSRDQAVQRFVPLLLLHFDRQALVKNSVEARLIDGEQGDYVRCR